MGSTTAPAGTAVVVFEGVPRQIRAALRLDAAGPTGGRERGSKVGGREGGREGPIMRGRGERDGGKEGRRGGKEW